MELNAEIETRLVCPDVAGEDILEIHRRAALARLARDTVGSLATQKVLEARQAQVDNMTGDVPPTKAPYFAR